MINFKMWKSFVFIYLFTSPLMLVWAEEPASKDKQDIGTVIGIDLGKSRLVSMEL